MATTEKAEKQPDGGSPLDELDDASANRIWDKIEDGEVPTRKELEPLVEKLRLQRNAHIEKEKGKDE